MGFGELGDIHHAVVWQEWRLWLTAYGLWRLMAAYGIRLMAYGYGIGLAEVAFLGLYWSELPLCGWWHWRVARRRSRPW